MKTNLILSAVLLVTAAAGDALAGEPWTTLLVKYPRLVDCVGKYCCDDYVPKCLPPACPVECFRCDDYCFKSLPCAQGVCCFCCDDYCPKCLPPLCGPPPAGLTCGGKSPWLPPLPKMFAPRNTKIPLLAKPPISRE
jgi:hypothetical protein